MVIYSHPQALGQCRAFLERSFPNAQVVASLSTVSAVEEMQSSKQTAAAIAPRRAAELYKSEIIAEGLQDSDVNVTRFVVLGGTDHGPTGRDKTSLCFSFEEDRPGSLYKVVREFAERHINLVKIESRPTKEGLGSYIFLIDLDGHKEDLKVKEALEVIQKDVALLRIFGSYPSFAQ
jgi:prephenate dehydratase